MTIDWSPFVATVGAAQRILLTTHIRSDCDALGSEIGMALALESLGKQVRIVNGDAVAEHLRFVDPQRRIEALGTDVLVDELLDYDVLIVLDTSAWIQLGDMGEVVRRTTAKKLVVDHHVSEDDLGAHVCKDATSDSTGRLVIQAADALGCQITQPMAFALLAAITTDTGWFRFHSTSGETLRAAARLLDAGARPEALYRKLYEQDSLARLKLVGRALERTTTECDGRLIYIWLTLEDFQATGADPSDTEDLINYTLRVRGSEVALLFTEIEPDKFKVSFRSRSDVDCCELAQQFAGGGHSRASGATISGTLDEVRTRVLTAARTAMDQA